MSVSWKDKDNISQQPEQKVDIMIAEYSCSASVTSVYTVPSFSNIDATNKTFTTFKTNAR